MGYRPFTPKSKKKLPYGAYVVPGGGGAEDSISLTNLISHWKLDEVNGDAIDSHGMHNLTDNNTVTSDTGKINTARLFTALNSEFFSVASHDDFKPDDNDFSIDCWVKLSSLVDMTIISKTDIGQSGIEYSLRYEHNNNLGAGAQRFVFWGSPDGSVANRFQVAANNFGAPIIDTWYHIYCYHDSINNLVGIAINNGVHDTVAHATGLHINTRPLRIGADGNNDAATNFMNGLIDEVSFWRRLLTTNELILKYNNGNGLAYPFTS